MDLAPLKVKVTVRAQYGVLAKGFAITFEVEPDRAVMEPNVKPLAVARALRLRGGRGDKASKRAGLRLRQLLGNLRSNDAEGKRQSVIQIGDVLLQGA